MYLSQLTFATGKPGSELACQPANQAAATMSTVAGVVVVGVSSLDSKWNGKDDAWATAETARRVRERRGSIVGFVEHGLEKNERRGGGRKDGR